ncbi:MAG: peptidoglycan-binding protein [Chloroflexi bacterium]|nr:peptidoglycan-binding protein [Chloroflexota bacterium]
MSNRNQQSGSLLKARVTRLKRTGPDTYKDSGATPKKDYIDCLFNPAELTLSKSSSWSPTAVAERNVENWAFGGGKGASLKMHLFFDTTDSGSDVHVYSDFLFGLLELDPGTVGSDKTVPAESYRCRFQWGKYQFFEAVIYPSVSVTYSMFLPDGTPVRAEADVTFQQVRDENIYKKQNPTSMSHARKSRVVLEGETLDWIAYQEYGDPALWRHIARENDLANPMELTAGQILRITPAP